MERMKIVRVNFRKKLIIASRIKKYFLKLYFNMSTGNDPERKKVLKKVV